LTHYYPNAAELYETFQGFAPQEEIKIPLTWPDKFGVIGRALDISYRSDKKEGGGDGTPADYIHLHPTPCVLLCAWAPGLLPFRYLSPPPGGEFATLGQCLDVSFASPMFGGERTLDFLSGPVLPMLGADPTKGALCIAFPWGGDPLIVWGPMLSVERRGIVG
jgi:hypothetical protein